MSAEAKRYLAIIQLKGFDRINDLPSIVEWVARFSSGKHEAVFSSKDGTLFGYFFSSSAPEYAMEAEFHKCTGTVDGDAVLIFEAGKLAGSVGFARAATWLQRH